jgi:hypothetical protein
LQFLSLLITLTTHQVVDVANKLMKREREQERKKLFFRQETTSTQRTMHVETIKIALGRNRSVSPDLCAHRLDRRRYRRNRTSPRPALPLPARACRACARQQNSTVEPRTAIPCWRTSHRTDGGRCAAEVGQLTGSKRPASRGGDGGRAGAEEAAVGGREQRRQ